MDVTMASEQNEPTKIDVREISIVLDEWSRTCDQVLKTLEEQINKISKKK